MKHALDISGRQLTKLYALSAFTLLFVGCTGLGDPFFDGRQPRNDRYYDDRYYDRDFEYQRRRDELREERYDVYQERRRLEDERRRLEAERATRPPVPAYTPPPQHHQQDDRCPPGFRPSERKCTSKERKRGCQDMRTPSGRGCVKR